jgi:hypothetical protein
VSSGREGQYEVIPDDEVGIGFLSGGAGVPLRRVTDDPAGRQQARKLVSGSIGIERWAAALVEPLDAMVGEIDMECGHATYVGGCAADLTAARPSRGCSET